MRHAVILAGGSGVRFWPLSRKSRPKQFLPLGGGRSLIRATLDRTLSLVPAERTWVVTARDQAARVRKELPEVPAHHVLQEPTGRNTAPAVYLAALAALREDPDAVMLVLPADAWVPRVGPYRLALGKAFVTAERFDRLALVGAKPTRAETGYGYILPGPPIAGSPARRVRRFVEKPNEPRARRYLAGGKHLWNCGIFAWKASVLVNEVSLHLPKLERAFVPLKFPKPSAKTLEQAYRKAPNISVDVGILERTDRAAVIPASFAWDDLGSWRALERLASGSFVHGEVLLRDSPGAIAWSEGGVVAVIGVPNAVVVHTADATLVVAKDRAQDVRDVVEALRADPRTRRFVE